MTIKSLTWNIGGGKHLAEGADPLLMDSYNVDGMSAIIEFIKNEQPDIITLQETQKGGTLDQVKEIADALGYPYYFHDIISESHIDRGTLLGMGIISRYQMTDHEMGLFDNPRIQVEWEDGRTVMTHDKGYMKSILKVGGFEIQVCTLHLTPFKRFNIDLGSGVGKAMIKDAEDKIQPSADRYLLQGDFNIDTKELKPYVPALFDHGLYEIFTEEPTTPNGRTYDHIIFGGMTNVGHRVDANVFTDHYPVIATFEVE